MNFLKSLPSLDGYKCGNRLIIYAKELINFPYEYDPKERKLTKLLFCKAACEICKLLLNMSEIGRILFYKQCLLAV